MKKAILSASFKVLSIYSVFKNKVFSFIILVLIEEVSMDIKSYVPKDSLDYEHINELFTFDDEKIKPILPDLLDVIRHTDWSVTEGVLQVLSMHQKALLPLIDEKLKATYTDISLKYAIVAYLLPFFDIEGKTDIINELKRIVSSPTKEETDGEVSFAAKELLKDDGIE